MGGIIQVFSKNPREELFLQEIWQKGLEVKEIGKVKIPQHTSGFETNTAVFLISNTLC